uniref:Reverse transcriptase Ty1/copia-type domain-containing protein n=1 Tax=Chromera velia CCMP2878 TaxID=1169474 RepID=A0A0G4FMY2_9ALVE|eukprot:Cvel_17741.t1-p1 / transcript=Cvel_17741.t1 / gene=Cvel_17741 / organism=Chromera_velia_CCMP2878 / gene_product=Copia protein, putative / transcript_product=Copia protein, putative / location=Cvel_scaffold1433:33385-36168(-) / protein_length=611 / sequence_SO=supercontig / SO=protein_coding / is_pseudo=false
MRCLCSVFDLSTQTLQTEKGVKAITLRWVRTWKLKEGKRVTKSRLVARGFQDSHDWSVLETYSGIADASLARVAFLWAISKGLQAAKMDVSTAFLQVPMKNAVWLRLPSNLPVEVYSSLHAGVFVLIQRAVYSLKDAPKVYTSYFKKKVSSLGWIEIAKSILVRKNKKGEIVALLVMHVDDLFIFSPSVDEDVKQIQELFDTDQPERIDNGELHSYVDMSIWMRPGNMLLDHSTYIEGMVKGVSEEVKKPLTEKDFLLPKTAETDMSLQEQQQKNVGCLGWAVKTQPSLSFLFSHLSRFNSRPSHESVLASEKALWHTFKTSRPLSLRCVPSLSVLLVWGDTYQLYKKEGRLGIENLMQLVDEGEFANLDEIGGLPTYTPIVRGGLLPPSGLSQPPASSDRAPFVPAEGPAHPTEKSPSPSDPSSFSSDLRSSASSHSRRRRCRRSRRSGHRKKVDIAAVPKFEGKQHIQEFADLWAPYIRVHLKRSNFDSDQEWYDNIILAFNHATNGNRQFKADIRKLRKGKKIPVEQIVDKLLEEYESALLAQQLAIRERVRHFPWDIQKRDGKGRVNYPKNTELSWPKIDNRLDHLTMDAGKIDMEVTVKEKKEMVI